MKGGKDSALYACSNIADPALVEQVELYGHHPKPTFRFVTPMNAYKEQQLMLQEARNWETLSLEEALASLERMAEPPLVDNCICILQKCRRKRNSMYAKQIYVHVCNHGLEAHRELRNYLVPMFVECGNVSEAHHVFNQLVDLDEYSWTSLIQGYIDCGKSQHALDMFEKMQEYGVSPSRFTLVALLKACARLKCVEIGQEIHAKIVKESYDGDLFIGSTLVDMYAGFGSLSEAREIFDNLAAHNVVSWTVLITGYAQQGLCEEALDCLDRMKVEGVSSDAVTFICSLKACGDIKVIARGREIHAEIAQEGFEKAPFVSNTLVDMYVKCGSFADARGVLEELPIRDVVSWTALIAGYVEHGQSAEVLNCLEEMQLEGVSPNTATFVCALKACGSIKAMVRACEIHSEVVKMGFEGDCFVGNSLVDMYTKCGSIEDAHKVFDKLPLRDVVSWNTLISGYVEHGLGEEALNSKEQMKLQGVSPNAVTFACNLKSCGSSGDIGKGRGLHDEIAKEGFENNPIVCSSLVNMYVGCNSLAEAQELFNELPVRDVLMWTALITEYVEHGEGEEVLKCLKQMQQEGVSPNAGTFVCGLQACACLGATDKGQEIHSWIVKEGLERDPFVTTTLVDMYVKCGLLADARYVFDKLPVRDVVSWSALIAGYAEHRHPDEAVNCFDGMKSEGISPNAFTFVCVLQACGSIGVIDRGYEMHIAIVKQGLDRSNYVGNTLVDMYVKHGSLTEAREVFDGLLVRDVVSWTALIAGYSEHGLGKEALVYFEQMQLEGVPPNTVTYVCSLKACGSVGFIDMGREIHTQILKEGCEKDQIYCKRLESIEYEAIKITVMNALIDTYGKCGSMLDAQMLFDVTPARDIVTWNALVAGYARLGQSELVFHSYERMAEEAIQPDSITYLSLLTVCSHVGLVGKAINYFESISKGYGITLSIEHHNCMVDLLGRAGQLDEAVAMVEKMPCQPDLATWGILLGACRKWGNVDLGRWAFDRAIRFIEKPAALFITMFNIYVDAHLWKEAKMVDAMRASLWSQNELGTCWIEVDGTVLTFNVGQTSFSQSIDIYAKLKHLSLKAKEEGYIQDFATALPGTCQDARGILCGCSGKLAIVCAVKNLQVCNMCHVAMETISKVEQRLIICRDVISFHAFKDGKCSCVNSSVASALKKL